MDVLLLLWQPSPKQGIVLGLHGCWVSHMTFPSFVMWWVTLSFQISNQPWISGISPTWLKCSLIFIYYWIQFYSNSLRTFISVFMRKTIYYTPYLVIVIVWLLVPDLYWLYKMNWQLFQATLYSERICMQLILSISDFIYYQVLSKRKTCHCDCLVWSFSCGEVLSTIQLLK